jgi:hypothetical protein
MQDVEVQVCGVSDSYGHTSRERSMKWRQLDQRQEEFGEGTLDELNENYLKNK